jgi:hypothetical protein
MERGGKLICAWYSVNDVANDWAGERSQSLEW